MRVPVAVWQPCELLYTLLLTYSTPSCRTNYLKSYVIEHAVACSTEEIRRAVKLNGVVDGTLNILPVVQSQRISAIDAMITAISPVQTTYKNSKFKLFFTLV